MLRILFVDDDANVLAGLQRMLRPLRRDWDMTFVPGGAEALAALEQRPVDVIVSDMRMPGMDGAALLAAVKQRCPDTVRIVLSGHSEKEAVLRSVGHAHQYLAKPCEPGQIRDVISRACALRSLLRDERLRELALQLTTIPSLPQIYTEIMAELQSPDASISRVGRIVARDVGMTAKILQIVNSAFFGLRRSVSDPAQAAGFLGVDTIKSLVLSAHVFTEYQSTRVDGLCLDALWRHSATTGTLAKRIAIAEGCCEQVAGDALTAGLLHDAGKLILAANLETRYGEIVARARDEHRPLWQIERERLASTHAEVGAYLFGLWGLPDPIVEAVAFHHHPAPCLDGNFTPLTAVYLANALELESDGLRPDEADSPLDLDALARAGWTDRLPAWREMHLEITQGEGVDG